MILALLFYACPDLPDNTTPGICAICGKDPCVCDEDDGICDDCGDPDCDNTCVYTFVFDDVLDQYAWVYEILATIRYKRKDVILDLSKSKVSASGGALYPHPSNSSIIVFDPHREHYDSAKGLIVSLILPDAATYLIEGGANPTFNYFTNLKHIEGAGIQIVSGDALANNITIESVSFPNLSGPILKDTFKNSVNLKTVNLPKTGHIAEGAFSGCVSLTEVSFPAVKIVEPLAFENCTALTTARFLANPARLSDDHPLTPWLTGTPGVPPFTPDSVVIYNEAFKGCVNLETLDIRNAWNVYFAGNALAGIGTELNLWLYDDDGAKSFGHPQLDIFLGAPGTAAISTINLFVPEATGASQIEKDTSLGNPAYPQNEPLISFIEKVYAIDNIGINITRY